MAQAKLQDARFHKIKISTGDRMLVRVADHLTDSERKKIKNAVNKALGEHVRCLVLNLRKFVILIHNQKEETYESLAGTQNQNLKRVKTGTFQVDCSPIEIGPTEGLVVLMRQYLNLKERREFKAELRDWAGEGVPIRIDYLHKYGK